MPIRFWEVTAWVCTQEPGGYGFEVWISKEFLEAARKCQYDPNRVQQRARVGFRESGYPVSDAYNAVQFGPFGVEQINHPAGDGRWVCLSGARSADIESGLRFDTHNLDTASQQSSLFAILLLWIQFVCLELES